MKWVPESPTLPAMSTVKEIETALTKLRLEEMEAVRARLDELIEDRLEVSEEFKAKIQRILPIIPEGQFINDREIQSATPAKAPGQIPVVFEYGEDVEALNLPTGAQASIAVYTHKFHALSIVRKVILRIKSWENYAPFLSHFDALH